VKAVPAPAVVERFRNDLDALIPPGEAVGLAVSGGPDSLALLLLATAARTGLIKAATVDHALRAGSRSEAEAVAALCGSLGVPHRILAPAWDAKPETAIQEKARATRYLALGEWMEAESLGALATGHHLDDQAETFVMRLTRGSGVKGLAVMRSTAPVPGCEDLKLLRPLLGWRRSELVAVCEASEVAPATDPSNSNTDFERVRVRQALAGCDFLDARAVAASAAALGQADAALEWAVDRAWQQASVGAAEVALGGAASLPAEIQRRLVGRAVGLLASEGRPCELRGRELDQLLASLVGGRQATLRGVLCSGGEPWRFVPAPNRTRPSSNLR
jgi:tRNA(Ile)-lysidine synthase